MFGKRKKEVQPVLDYSKWENELGFLNLIISRKQNATREFLINIYSNQKNNTDYLSDDEIDPVVEKVVIDIMTQISGNYKTFLINKYFGSELALVRYVTEEVYITLVSDAVNRNYNKSKINLQTKAAEIFSKII